MKSLRPLILPICILLQVALACSLPFAPGTPAPPASATQSTDRTAGASPTALPPLPPELLDTEPSQGATLPPDSPIALYFDQAMDQPSVESAFSIDPQVDGSFSWPDNRTLEFSPGATLGRGQEYAVTVAASARSAQGVPAEGPVTASFRTAGTLEVTQVQPAPAAADVSSTDLIQVAFNQPVVSLDVAGDPPQPVTFDPPLGGQGEWVGTSLYVYRPAPALPAGQQITARVEAGLTAPTGAVLPSAFSWTFTTRAPRLVSSEPTQDANGVRLDPELTFTFNQPISRASFEGSFELIGENGEPVPGEFEWNEEDSEVRITPDTLLDYDSEYVATFGETTGPGGSPLSGPDRVGFTTVPPPTIVGLDPAQGGVLPVYDRVVLTFSGPMEVASLVDNLNIQPALENRSAHWIESENALSVSGDFEAGVNYTLTIGPEANDAYGTPLEEPVTLAFRVGDFASSLEFTRFEDVLTFAGSTASSVELQTINVTQVDLSLYQLSLDEFVEAVRDGYGFLYEGGTVGEEIRSWSVPVTAPRNQRQSLDVPLSEGQPLPTGPYLLQVDSPSPLVQPRSRFLLIRGTELVVKSSEQEFFVWASDLAAGASIEEFSIRLIHESGRRIGEPELGREGIAAFDAPELEDRFAGLYAVTGQPGDPDFGLTSWTWTNGIEPYRFGVPSRYRTDDVELYLYTDRPLYRPGQTVHFRGVLREWTPSGYALPAGEAPEVSLIDPRGETLDSRTFNLGSFGTFHGSFELSEETALGTYRISTERHSVHFDVAAYRKPELSIDVRPSHEDRIVGQPTTATIQADYFFGAPASGQEVEWRAFGTPSFFPDFPLLAASAAGPSFAAFPFGSQVELASGRGVTGPDGALTVDIPTMLEEPRALDVTVEATISEGEALPVSGRGTFNLHPAGLYLRLKPTRFGFPIGEQALVRLHAEDIEGQPIGEQRTEIEVSRVTWEQTVSDEGELQWESTETLVNRDVVETGEDGSVLVSFQPSAAGSYRVEAMTEDSEGRPVEGSARVWILGPGQNIWRQPAPGQIDLVPDQETYFPGETARILIPSPFSEPAEVLITIERDRVLSHQIVTLPPTGHTVELPIEREYLPNVYLSAVALRAGTEAGPALAAGLVELPVSAEGRRLSVRLTSDHREVGPGDSVTYQIEAHDASGAPAQAEFSLSFVDEALLALSAPNSQDPFTALYGLRPLTVRTAASLTRTGEGREIAQEATGVGGGGGGEAIAMTVRSRFEDTAFWHASVETDDEGRARITVRLPDNLTTWRVQARGVTAETEVGQATDRLTVSKPLLVRPITPRFFTAGDRSTVAAEVHNNTESSIESDVRLQAAGATLTTPSTHSVSIPSGQSVRVQWELSVGAADGVALTFSAQGGGYQDASTPTVGTAQAGQLPVLRYQVPTTAGASGWLPEEGSRTESVSLPPRYDPQAGELAVTLEPSLGSLVQRGLEALKAYPYESTEHLASRLAAHAAALRTLQKLDEDRPGLEEEFEREAGEALRLLQDRQNEDGGWGWWPQSNSDRYLTAYTLRALDLAREAGLELRPEAQSKAANYLSATLLDPTALDEESLTQHAFTLWILTQEDRIGRGPLGSLAEERDRLSTPGKALLIAALALASPNDASLPALISSLESEAALTATGTHWDRPEGSRRSLGSSVTVTSQAIHALLAANPTSRSLDGSVRWLVLSRSDGAGWRTSHDTAWALQALLGWIEAQGSWQADYDYQAHLNGQPMAQGSFEAGGLRSGVQVTEPIESLHQDEPNALTIERGPGAGTLSYTAHLTVHRPVEDVPAASRGLTVERTYYRDDGECDFAENPCERIETANRGDDLLVRLTVVVPNDSFYVAVEDYLPAGTEPIDPGLLTSASRSRPRPGRLELPWLGWYFDRVEIDDESVRLFADELPAGTYSFVYRLHASFTGSYRTLPARAGLVYFPEVYGQTAGHLFAIEP